jgi:hypothetical protein
MEQKIAALKPREWYAEKLSEAKSTILTSKVGTKGQAKRYTSTALRDTSWRGEHLSRARSQLPCSQFLPQPLLPSEAVTNPNGDRHTTTTDGTWDVETV